ncbi:MAG: GTP-binding protein [Anaerolineaceae bacterium]|nr:GTP-binding protein [Anaerolineaceae bacterium]
MSAYPIRKVLIAGDDNVGKTSLVRRYCEGRFESSHQMTIGVDFQGKVVELPGGPVKLSIWDLAGQQRFESIRTSFYRGSLATALVYDLDVPDTLKSLARWFKEIIQMLPKQPFLVVGNKCDLVTETTDRVGLQLAAVIHAEYVRTSALTGEGVDAMFEKLAVMANDATASLPQPDPNEPSA